MAVSGLTRAASCIVSFSARYRPASIISSTWHRHYSRGLRRYPIRIIESNNDQPNDERTPLADPQKELSLYQDLMRNRIATNGTQASARKPVFNNDNSEQERVHGDHKKHDRHDQLLQQSKGKKGRDAVVRGGSLHNAQNILDERPIGKGKKEETLKTKSSTKDKEHEQIFGGLQVEKDSSVAERKLSSVMQLVKSSKARKINGKIFLEGERLIADAISAGASAEMLFFSRTELLNSLPLRKCKQTKLFQVDYNKIQLWSDLTTSPGIIGIFSIPKLVDTNLLTGQGLVPLTIICDNIRDPGNIGSILRCAAAIGCQRLVTTKGCVDVWDSKVLRSAAGAHFRLPLTTNVGWEHMCNLVNEKTIVILADACTTPTKLPRHLAAKLPAALLEAEGRGQSSSAIVEVQEDGSVLRRDDSYNDEKLLDVYRHLPLPNASYDKLDLAHSENVLLIIGGEAQGLHSAAYKLAHDCKGLKASIPLENGVESLNASVAAGIIAYEIRRQLQKS